jgi:hypothetical protein
MAFVNGTIAVTFTFQDDDLATSSESVHLPSGTSIADAGAFATNYVALLTPVSNCALLKYNITQEVYDDTYPVAIAGSDVEDKGVLTIRTANNGTSKLTWPGVLESVLVNTITPPGTFINLQNAAVAALVNALINGVLVNVATAVAPSSRNGNDFRSVKEAFKQNTSSQKSREYRG